MGNILVLDPKPLPPAFSFDCFINSDPNMQVFKHHSTGIRVKIYVKGDKQGRFIISCPDTQLLLRVLSPNADKLKNVGRFYRDLGRFISTRNYIRSAHHIGE